MKRPLMVIQSTKTLTADEQLQMFEMIKPVAQLVGAELIISDSSTRIAMHQDLHELFTIVERQTKAIELLVNALTCSAK